MAAKSGVKPTTDAELLLAGEAGRKRHAIERRALSVTYDAAGDKIQVELVGGISVTVPRELVGELDKVPVADMGELRASPIGYGIELPSHDIHILVQGLLDDLLGAGDRGERQRVVERLS